MKRLVTALVLGLGFTINSAQAEKSASPPAIPYWSVWADTEGVTHQTRCAVSNLQLEDFASSGNPEWVSQNDPASKRYVFNVMPVGWVGNWHKNPAPQWIIPLSGRWFVKTTDGKRLEMGPGEISFGGDQNAQIVNGQQGHQSGSVGNQPAKVIIIQLTQPIVGLSDPKCSGGGLPIR
ncbi:hypothetical protein ZMO02_02700 [Zymomonas mobilis subsp. pomaceae]|uniref:Cupin domain-containing protein n=2 Tax=Zymomonas mobilis TaxID=542 RepID=F8EVY1_ZYMMT|nr:hypothetical protein Zymop_0556 [Zymomonas mobilis subsp. pomaceae ATCC 29192]GEB88633.1 hypothetical protein ZMO02_02700 [Zymomonas mobilis subsp. pomaceae]